MARRTVWLLVAAILSLVALVYAGVVSAFSIPVTAEMEAASRMPGDPGPAVGTRALVVPVADPTLVATRAEPGDGPPEGALLAVGEPGASFPALARGVTLLRALAYVAPTANGSYVPAVLELANVSYAVGDEARAGNVSIDVAALAGGKAGFLAKADRDANVTFVPAERVVGVVQRFDASSSLYSLFALGLGGFLAPLILIIVTHRAAGRAADATAATGLCRECRASVDPRAKFCMKCGAWLDGGDAG